MPPRILKGFGFNAKVGSTCIASEIIIQSVYYYLIRSGGAFSVMTPRRPWSP